jgi:hypothetical protein
MRAFCSEQLKRKKKENGREDLKYGGSLLIQYDGDDGLGLGERMWEESICPMLLLCLSVSIIGHIT